MTEPNVLPPYLILVVVLMIVSVIISVSTIIVQLSLCSRRKLKKKRKNRIVNTVNNAANQSSLLTMSNTDEDIYDTIDDTNLDGLHSYKHTTLPTTVIMDSNKAYNPLSEVLCDEMKLESNAAYGSVNPMVIQ